jgi:hypothetical protein
MRNDFDMQRATFWLVAAIFALIGVSFLIAEAACIFNALYRNIQPGCPAADRITEGFASLLAAALAYAAGQSSSRKDPPPPPPQVSSLKKEEGEVHKDKEGEMK